MNMSDKKNFFDGDPRMMFVFGLVTGIAIMALLGGMSLDVFAKNGSKSVVQNPTPVVNNNGGVAAPAGELAPVTEDDHVRGDLKKAKVVLVEYSDFECPFCQRFHPTMKQLQAKYGDDIAWVYRHFPLKSIHPNAEAAGNAAECAGEQGKFWEYADALFEDIQGFNTTRYTQIAKDLRLNEKRFTDCVSSGKYLGKVNADFASGQAAGVTGTPATFINGQLVSGALPIENMTDIIDEILANN